jgi:hypothetical protein
MKKYEIVALTVLIMFIPSIHGCSLIGLGFGTITDNLSADSLHTRGFDAGKITLGKTVRITTGDGQQILGHYQGIRLSFPQEYAQRYDSLREKSSPDFFLPRLNSDVELTLRSGEKEEGEFLGFDFRNQQLLLEDTITTDSVFILRILTRAKESSFSRNYTSGSVTEITDRTGEVYSVRNWEKFVLEGKIPLVSLITVENPDSIFSIPAEAVSRIDFKESKDYGFKWFLFGFGVAFDLTLIFTLLLDNAVD